MPFSTPPQDLRPIFIIGAPRSGTSITSWVLGQHPNIQLMPETTWIATTAAGGYQSHAYGSARGRFSHLSNTNYGLDQFMQRLGGFVHAVVNDCFEQRCERRYGDFRAEGKLVSQPGLESNQGFQLRHAVEDPKQRWVDATPFNSYFIWALVQMFPGARFIHNLRRPEDVATSLEGFDKFGHSPLELEEGLRTWGGHTRDAWLAERWLGSEAAFRLDFTRLSREPRALVEDLLGFLGEDFAEECMTPLQTRINSSEVDDRRAENLEKLRDHATFGICQALYQDALARPPSAELDAEAGEMLRQQFVDYCESHPLI